MKKLVLVAASALVLCGCGNSWELTKKNLASDLSSLKRHVVVYDSWTNKQLWEHTGEVYLECMNGNYTIIWRDTNGKARKNDYIGNHIAVIMEEVAK